MAAEAEPQREAKVTFQVGTRLDVLTFALLFTALDLRLRKLFKLVKLVGMRHGNPMGTQGLSIGYLDLNVASCVRAIVVPAEFKEERGFGIYSHRSPHSPVRKSVAPV